MSLRHVLLALLSKEPNTGYRLGRLLQQEAAHLWSARLQQIYGELAKSEAQGLIQAECYALPNRPAKKVYSLTAAGEAILDDWLAQRPDPPPARDALLVRLYCLDRLPPGTAVRRIEERLERSEADARDLRGRRAEASGAGRPQLGRLLTLEASFARAEAEAAWCRRALSLLRGHAGEEPAGDPRAGLAAAGA
jgi:DNA-binding PadR family transcriptional regulator